MISIFAHPAYLGNRYHGHTKEDTLQRVSSRIRGEEISEYLGANFNSKRGDVNIFVKPYSLNEVNNGDWVDFLDGGRIFNKLKECPMVNIIAGSLISYIYLKDNLPNTVVLIPQHHINFERARRLRTGVLTGGYIGSPSPVATAIYDEVGERFREKEMDFATCFNFKTRQDAINLYLKLDIFVIADFSPDTNPHKIPTKIINAASFGVPSIAYPLKGYEEIEGFYIPVNNLDELITEAEKFKDWNYYHSWSEKVFTMAEKYHISKIADLYRKL